VVSTTLGLLPTLSERIVLNHMERPYHKGHPILAERTPKFTKLPEAFPVDLAIFTSIDDRRARGAWLFTLTHFLLAHAFPRQNRDDALYHAEINIYNG
jgi:hypothetical protein